MDGAAAAMTADPSRQAAPDAGPVALDMALWTMAPDPRTGEDIGPLRSRLSTNEWTHVTRFKAPAHAWSSAATRVLLRIMLARFHGADPLAWHFLTEPGGRPRVDRDRTPFATTPETRPRFSLSHTQGLAACMVSLGPWPVGAELGVDVEWTDRGHFPAGRLATRFFHPDEAAALQQIPRGPAREALFLTLWTRKEAVLKALGLGIANHLARYACLGDPPSVTGDAAMVGRPVDWTLGSETAGPSHRLSWAVHAPVTGASAPPTIRLHRHHLNGGAA